MLDQLSMLVSFSKSSPTGFSLMLPSRPGSSPVAPLRARGDSVPSTSLYDMCVRSLPGAVLYLA